jgi:4-hydroxybenzoate polyprenyltransferase
VDRPNTDDREPHLASADRPTAWPAAALRIVIEVVAFRVRRLEMANLAAAIAVMCVLRLPLGDGVLRTLFAALLNVLVYLNNDYHDVAIDVRAPDKDLGKARFLAANMGAALRAQWGLAAALVAIAVWHSLGLVIVLIAGGGICWGYSAYFKHRPWLDVAAMTAWGMVMPLCGSPLDRTLGGALALQLGVFSAVFESIQVVRDHRSDAGQGVRTTAVALGPARTFLLARVLMLLCAVYAALVLHPIAGLIALAAVLLPMRDGEREAERLWTRVKLIYGSAWLLACAFVYTQGSTSGWLLRLDVDAVIGWR